MMGCDAARRDEPQKKLESACTCRRAIFALLLGGVLDHDLSLPTMHFYCCTSAFNHCVSYLD